MSNDAAVQDCGCLGGTAGAGQVAGAGEVSGPACTLPHTELGARIDAFRALFQGSFVERARDVEGVLWRLARSSHTEQESRRLAALEATCCSPLEFTVDVDADHVIWRITGPASAKLLLDAFYELPSEAVDAATVVASNEITSRRAGGALVGLGVACAACCAAPFALPWLLPLIAPVIGGLAGWRLGSAELVCIGVLVGGGVLVAMLLLGHRRRHHVA